MEKFTLKSALQFLCTVQHESVSCYTFALYSFWHAFVSPFILFFPLSNF